MLITGDLTTRHAVDCGAGPPGLDANRDDGIFQAADPTLGGRELVDGHRYAPQNQRGTSGSSDQYGGRGDPGEVHTLDVSGRSRQSACSLNRR